MGRATELLDELVEEAPQGAANALRIVGMFLGVLFGLFVVAVLLVLVFMLIWG